MTDRATTGFLEDADTVIATITGDVEPELAATAVSAAIAQAAPTRPQRRRLAQALRDDPDLGISGRPEGPPQVERLIRALLVRGARRLVQPLCGHCHQPKPLPQRDGETRICGACDSLRRGAAEPCSRCGLGQKVAGRDSDGQPLCGNCTPYQDHDPLDELRAVISALDPNLDQQSLTELIQRAVPQQFQRHQVLWELQERPALLTGQGAHGSPRANALLRALIAAGAHSVVAPTCPSCDRTVALTHQRDGLRCCRRCYDQATSTLCSRCHQRKQVASRTSTGDPVCNNCFRTDRANHERCVECGRTALVYHHGDDQPRCRRCFRAPTATCSICGKDKPCYFTATDRPRCENCSRRMRQLPCTRCGKTLPVCSTTPDGQPLCSTCSVRREPCHSCGRTRKVAGRIPQGPLCPTCYAKHPVSFRPCSNCSTVERLHHHGLCTRCACHQQLLALLCHADGDLHGHMQPVFQVLANSEPARVLRWLEQSAARQVLANASTLDQPLTHATLDDYPPHQAIDHLRKVLVVGNVLPQRDEYLAAFERWISPAVDKVSDPQERRIIRRFALWHQLRRLRTRAERGSLTADRPSALEPAFEQRSP